MIMDVLILAEQDTRLHKASSLERCGPCPDSHCRCQTDGFRVRWKGDRWRFMCRGCYDSQDGWGDEIDYLRHYRHLSFKQAQALLEGTVVAPPPEVRQKLPLDCYSALMKEHIAELWGEDTAALDYARSRRLTDKTIRDAEFGYSLVGGVPRLLIPSKVGGHLVAIMRRDLRPGIPHKERWKDAKGSQKTLYLAGSLARHLPTLLCEDAFSALSIVQEAGDLVNAVATCGVDCCQDVKWVARLARMPSVFVALDADDAGDEHSTWWLEHLPNARRLRPILKDINDMLMDGWDIRTWCVSQLETPETETIDRCSCGCSVVDDPGLGEYDEHGQYTCSKCLPKPPITPSLSEFSEHAQALVSSVFGACEMRVDRRGEYTLDQHVQHRLQEIHSHPGAVSRRNTTPFPPWLIPGSRDWNKYLKHNSELYYELHKNEGISKQEAEKITREEIYACRAIAIEQRQASH